MGIEPARVIEVYAEKLSKPIVGSGYLIADRLVLTARHVTRDATKVEVRPLGTPEWLPAHAVWPIDPSVEVDAALLWVDKPCPLPPGQIPVRWGSLEGNKDPINCSAAGFPWCQARPDNVRDAEQLYGFVAPLTQEKSKYHAISIITSAPLPSEEGGSPWGGMSGAALFAGAYLIGVVVLDPARFGPDRLVALRADALVKMEGFAHFFTVEGAIPVITVTPRQHFQIGAALSLVLRPPYRPLPDGFRLASGALGELLIAEHGIVPFLRRAPQSFTLDALEKWCDGSGPLAVRVLTGQGGTGKSRIAAELCVECLGRGWDAGFGDIRSPEGETRLELERCTLIVVDNADVNVSFVAQLIGQFADRPPGAPRVCILLIARTSGAWYQRLRQEQQLVDLFVADPDTGDEISLDSVLLDLDGRVEHFNAASRAFAPYLGRAPVTASSNSLSDPTFELPLLVHMHALLATLGESFDPSSSGNVRAKMINRLLLREKQRWDETRKVRGLDDLDPEVAHRAVAVATLAGAATEAEAVDILAAIDDLTDDRERRGKVARWLRDLHSGDLYLNPLRPDLLAEQMLAETPNLSSLVIGIRGSPECTTRLLNRLCMAGEHHAVVREALQQLIFERLDPLTCAAIDSPGGSLPEVLNRAIELCQSAGDPTLEATIASILERIPHRSAGLAPLAASLAVLAVDNLRQLAGENPVHYQPMLGTALARLSLRLWDVARREEALATSREAVALLTSLSDADPEHLRRLHQALTTQGLLEMWTHHWPEAAPITARTIQVCRQFPVTDPGYETQLAGALLNHGTVLSELQDPKAIELTEEALQMYQHLAKSNPEARLWYVSALGNLGLRRHQFGQHQADVQDLQQAIEICEQAARKEPDKYQSLLGWTFNNLGAVLAEHGSFAEAVTAQRASVDHYRQATAAESDVNREPLLRSLEALTFLLVQYVRALEPALASMEEAVSIVRQLAKSNPQKFSKWLVGDLRDLAQVRKWLGNDEEANQAWQEASEIEKALPQRPNYVALG